MARAGGLACDIRIRAEYKAGQLLTEMEKNGERESRGGDRRSKSNATTLKQLSDLGISKDQSSSAAAAGC